MPKKSNPLLKGLSFVLFLLLFASFGFFAGKLAFDAAADVPKITVVVIAILLIPIFLIVVGVHEAGHAVAGLRVGFDFRMYVIGPFMWNKEQHGWKFEWNKNVNTAGGMVICLPTDAHDLSRRFSIYAAGGPIASVLLAIVAYGLYLLVLKVDTTGNAGLVTLAYILLVMAFLSAVIFLVTAIPSHMGGFSSDGARILRLLNGGEAARFDVLILKIIASTTSGLRPKLLDMEELHEAQALATKLNAPLGVYVHGYLHQATFDNGDLQKAEQHLLDYIAEIEKIPQGLRNSVWLDAAFFYAYGKKDLGQALQYWNQFKPTAMISKAQVYATEAAIAELQDDHALALSKIAAAEKEIPNMLDKGNGVALKERLDGMKQKVRM